MNLLIDFINVKEFSAEILLDLHKKHGLVNSLGGQEKGYEEKVTSRQYLEKVIFFLNPKDPLAVELSEDVPEKASLPGDERFSGFLAYLKIWQDIWSERLKETITKGPNLELLNETEEKVKVYFEPGASLWEVRPRYWLQGADFEEYLAFDYLHTFLTVQGGTLQKLRTCKNPDCGKWFIYNRPKQTFCCESCRHNFHNHVKIRSGYLAAHQRKGRAEKPSIYNY